MIKHHLKDGKVLNSIKGHLVRKEDVPQAYQLINLVNEVENKDHEKKRPYSKT